MKFRERFANYDTCFSTAAHTEQQAVLSTFENWENSENFETQENIGHLLNSVNTELKTWVQHLSESFMCVKYRLLHMTA